MRSCFGSQHTNSMFRFVALPSVLTWITHHEEAGRVALPAV